MVMLSSVVVLEFAFWADTYMSAKNATETANTKNLSARLLLLLLTVVSPLAIASRALTMRDCTKVG
jgi:hypothetical protein